MKKEYVLYIALGSAYGYSEQYAEGAEAYKEALKCPTISTREKLDTYWGLSGCYIGLKDEENAVIILNQEKEILEKLANAKPTNYPLYGIVYWTTNCASASSMRK